MAGFARAERDALADTLIRVGPDAPTLCSGWSAADLAAHLVIRDSRPDAAAGIMVKPLAGWNARVQAGVRDRLSFEALVTKVRQGPPFWSPMRIPALDELTNTAEFFIHNEDLRRPAGDAPRELDPALSEQLWRQLRKSARLQFRAAPVGVTLVRHESADEPLQTVVAKAATPLMVTVSGPAGELTLFASGRMEAAQVELSGEDSAIQRLRTTKLGI